MKSVLRITQTACLYDAQQQVTCRSQTSFVGIAGMFGGRGGDREREKKGPPSGKSVSLIAQVISCNAALLP